MRHTQKRTRGELRRFGFTMAVPFAAIGGLLLWHERPLAPYILAAAGLFLVAGLLAPRALGPVERTWMAFARRLSIVSTFVLLTLSFYLVITPMSLLLRLLRKDRLQLKPDPGHSSYWVPVEPDGPGTRPTKPF